jgi:ATP-binding cassette subfamily B protein
MPGKKSFFVPEVVQTSEMDCGPAALKALLEGFGISASYGRLREACQTEVDGTSIDTIEQIANQLGLKAEQVMLPSDHLLLPEADALPALVVTRQPNGVTHFVILWSVHGRLVQVMDPGSGRRWVDAKKLLADLFIHRFGVPAEAFREWAGTESFLAPLRRRLGDLGLDAGLVAGLIAAAVDDPSWRGLGALDAATRMITSIVGAGGLERGQMAGAVLARFVEEALPGETLAGSPIPASFWFVDPAPPDPDAPESLFLCGAVLIHVDGVRAAAEPGAEAPGLSPGLAAALQEPPLHPERELWGILNQDGLFLPSLVASATLLATVTTMIEAFLLQAVMGMRQRAAPLESREFVVVAQV